jgi:hypothetical protein
MIEPRLSDAELLHQIEAAREADRIADLTEPRARDAWYDPAAKRIQVELKSGGAFAFPPSLFPELEGRTPRELMYIEVSPSGEGLAWEHLDVHIETAGALVALLGPSMFRAFASVGGRATSERKAAAARENGRKGGRPRKRSQDIGHRLDPGFGVMKVAEPQPLRRRDVPDAGDED